MHGGAGVGAQAALLQDPSREDFCELITGIDSNSARGTLGDSKAACLPFQSANIMDLDQCGREFCSSGINGFERFVSKTFDYIRSNLVNMLAIISTAAL